MQAPWVVTVSACYWQTNTASAGIAAGNGETTPFDAGEFPAVSHAAWGTGNGEENE